MGGYAVFVWPPYIIVTLFLVGLWWVSRRALKQGEAELEILEAQNPRRSRRRSSE